MRLILQRWWLVLLCGLGFAALAFGVTGFQKGHYTATTRLTVNDYTVGTGRLRQPVSVVPIPSSADAWVTAGFRQHVAAAKDAIDSCSGRPA